MGSLWKLNGVRPDHTQRDDRFKLHTGERWYNTIDTREKREEMYVYEAHAPVEVFPYESIFPKSGMFLKIEQVKSSQIH